MMSPLIPTFFDIVMTVLTMLALAYSVVAFVSLIRTRNVIAERFVIWFLIILMVPVLGATAWFAYGRRAEAARP